MQFIFDAHLDLAYLARAGRDMRAATLEALATMGPDAPGCVSLPALRESLLRACLATIFLEPLDAADPRTTYSPGDPHQACASGLSQLREYQCWLREGLVAPLQDARANVLRLGILLEGADCLRDERDLAWWAGQGVVAVGLSWAQHSRYASGNAGPAHGHDLSLGLTPLGLRLVREIDRLGLTHDASHLSDAALHDLFEATSARVVATHSNPRALLSGSQRHLSDETIREIARREGVIGLNLFEPFLLPPKTPPRATITQCVACVLHVCEVVGHARCIGLGSDMDGGFPRTRLPVGLDAPALLPALLDALRDAGLSDADVRAFAWDNWARVFLP